MAGLLDHAYVASPVWLQQLGVSAYGVVWKRRRFGGRFREAVREFISREAYSYDEWDYYQTFQLRQLLSHSFKFVPHYREVFVKSGISEKDLAHIKLAELSTLPPLEKQEILQNQDRLIASNIDKRRLHTYLTSGTTGTPLAVKFTSRMHQTWSAAIEVRCRQWAGLSYRMSRAMIGGRLIVPKAECTPPFWRYNLAERQLYLSAFHISPTNVPDYVEALNRFQPDYLVGYASSHFFLARMISELKLPIYQPKAVLTSSEKLTAEMRKRIEQTYRCEVFDAYSGVEACCLASECEAHQMHISPDTGIIELLNQDAQPVDVGESGEIVATGLLNFAQPLIRYRTGDWATLSFEECRCGRGMPTLKELIGRLEDTVVGRDGREMACFHRIFAGLSYIRESQVIQDSLSNFRIRLVVGPHFSGEELEIIRRRFAERLGPIDLTFEFVNEIERTERGKFRAVISKVQRKTLGPQVETLR